MFFSLSVYFSWVPLQRVVECSATTVHRRCIRQDHIRHGYPRSSTRSHRPIPVSIFFFFAVGNFSHLDSKIIQRIHIRNQISTSNEFALIRKSTFLGQPDGITLFVHIHATSVHSSHERIMLATPPQNQLRLESYYMKYMCLTVVVRQYRTPDWINLKVLGPIALYCISQTML